MRPSRSSGGTARPPATQPAPSPQHPGGTARPSALRRGLGTIFILAAVLYFIQMVFATLYAQGRLPGLDVPVSAWEHIYLAHFAFLIGAGTLFILLESRRTGGSGPRGIFDLLFGFFGFLMLLAATGVILVRGLATPWFSMAPGLFLLFYGWRLRAGRQLWRRLDEHFDKPA